MSMLAVGRCFAFAALLVAFVRNSGDHASRAHNVQSIHLDCVLCHPEEMTGLWEAPDGTDGAVGIMIELSTMVSNVTDTSAWLPQTFQRLMLGIYQRKGWELKLGEANFFEASNKSVNLEFDDDLIEVHLDSAHSAPMPSVDVSLRREADGCWQGRFHRGDFDQSVALCRPKPGEGVAIGPLVGTWSHIDGSGSCMHIYQTGANAFAGWTDALQLPVQIRYANHIPVPNRLFENYGSLISVQLSGRGVAFDMNPLAAFGGPSRHMGRLSSDGTEILEDTGDRSRPNYVPMIWRKMRGDSCVDRSSIRSQRVSRFKN